MQSPVSQAPNRFAGLPTEIIWEILLKANPKDIVSYCLTSKEANLICEDDSFWRKKLWVDFGKHVQVEGVEWKVMYQILSTIGEDNSPIAAGYRNYSIIDNQGNLYMAGEDAIYTKPREPRESVMVRADLIKEISEIKISKIPAKIPMDSKVISVSQGGNLISALTDGGIAHIWEISNEYGMIFMISNLNIPKEQEKWTIELTNKFGNNKNKAIKVVIFDDHEYAIIMNDGSIRMNIGMRDRHIKYSNTYGKYINIMGSYGKYYALTTSGTIMGFQENAGKLAIFTLINLPEPIKKLSAKNGSYAALSKSGNIYIWENITIFINSTMTKYEEVINVNSNNKFPVYKVNLPQPISSIYMASISDTNSRLMAVSIYGKLYSLQGDKMGELTEIDIGHDVKYVAVGGSFTAAVTADRIVNYWDHQ